MPRCPLCASQCDRVNYEGVVIYNCGECGGHWLNQARLDVIINRREYEMPEPVKQKMIEIADESNTSGPIMCHACGKTMLKEQFKHWPKIQIDRCQKCNGIWLDRGELEKCQIFWEYLQDHPDEWENQDIVTRQALLEAELKNRRAEMREQASDAREAKRTGYYGTEAVGIAKIISSLFRR